MVIYGGFEGRANNNTIKLPIILMVLKRIYFAVTNDLVFDQRMIRICTSLSKNGYQVTLVGRKHKSSHPLSTQPFRQVRLHSLFAKGKWMYAVFNLHLFFYLLFKKTDIICSIDLDTIIPCWLISKIKKIPRVYDAHELFCEMKEVKSRPSVYRIWKRVERFAVPKFNLGYTVNQLIANEFKKMYGVQYAVIRNITVLDTAPPKISLEPPFILYQGAVNEGRSFESLIPAFQWINTPLVICGDGNFMTETRKLVQRYRLENKVIFKGRVAPDELKHITPAATIGITLCDRTGLSTYYSLANRFFDYMHAGVPQLCVDYPVYREINEQYEVAVLISDLSPENIATHINALLNDPKRYERLRQNCFIAKQVFNWQNEEKRLIDFYKKI